jgi:hypothetical protein
MSENSERFLGYADRMAFGITREAAPIYVFGDTSPRSFSRGKRGVAGTMQIRWNELAQFYMDTPMRAIYEETVGDENVQIVLDGVQLMSEGLDLTIDNIINSTDDAWTFIAKTVKVRRLPANNRQFAKELLKKEWIPDGKLLKL